MSSVENARSLGKHNKLGRNHLIFYFKEVYGILEMDYYFFNEDFLQISVSCPQFDSYPDSYRVNLQDSLNFIKNTL